MIAPAFLLFSGDRLPALPFVDRLPVFLVAAAAAKTHLAAGSGRFIFPHTPHMDDSGFSSSATFASLLLIAEAVANIFPISKVVVFGSFLVAATAAMKRALGQVELVADVPHALHFRVLGKKRSATVSVAPYQRAL